MQHNLMDLFFLSKMLTSTLCVCVVCKGEAEVRGDGWDRVRCMARRMDCRDAGWWGVVGG